MDATEPSHMELAIHIRQRGQLDELDRIPNQVCELYEDLEPEAQNWVRSIPERVERVYVGDEFCVHRMPEPDVLEAITRSAGSKGWPVTLLTPPVTDEGLDRCSRLFRLLEREAPDTEVVANDWGLLCLLKDNHPSLAVAAGRLLNKGFKDPRLADPERAADISEDANELLNGCSFSTPSFQKKLREMDVRRFERDLLPYGEPDTKSTDGLGTSVYFPFGYVSTGRVCWVASFKAPAAKKFSPLAACHGPCDGLLLEMDGARSNFRLFEGGNTVFYLYPPSVLGSFATDPTYKEVRLVCQGLAI
jgi:hypothetical protein